MSPYDLPDYHALIRGIRDIDRADGDSTLARLVCADWLEERGEGWRAALIRSQCGGESKSFQVDNTPPLVADRGQPSTRWHAFACPKGSTDHFRKTLPPPPESSVWWRIQKGFVYIACCPLAWWLAHGPDLCRRHPVRDVMVTDTPTVDVVNRIQSRFASTTNHDGTPNFHLLYAMQDALIGVRNEPASFVTALCPVLLRWAEHEADRPTTSEG